MKTAQSRWGILMILSVPIAIVIWIFFLQTAFAAGSQYSGLRLPCLSGSTCTVTRGGSQHGVGRHAVDFNLRYQDFPAIRGGVVVFAGSKSNGLGTQLWVDNNDGYCTLYGHLNTIYVSQGSFIGQGQIVAQSGNTGNSTGPHLHVVVTQKSNGQCTAAQNQEVAMIFDELPGRELTSGDSLTSLNSPPLFADVHGSHWAIRWIDQLYADGITSGCAQSPLRYCPERYVTRAEMAKFLLSTRYGGNYRPPSGTGRTFDDVPSNHWAVSWIEQLYQEGITSGCGQNPLRYCPDRYVTRAEMAKFLLSTRHGGDYRPPSGNGRVFNDVSSGYWAVAWIEQLYSEGITSGCAQNPLRYCPDRFVTRAEMAKFLLSTRYGGSYRP